MKFFMKNDNRDETANTMNNTAAYAAHPGSTIQPVLRSKTAEGGPITIRRFIPLAILTLALLSCTTPPLHAQSTTPAPDALAVASDPSVSL